MEKVDVPLQVARHVIWWFGDRNLGVQPGSFIDRLLTTLSGADEENRAKLYQVYPEYVYAVHCVQREPWGLEWLRSKVKRADLESPADLFEASEAFAVSTLADRDRAMLQVRELLDVIELAWSREITPSFGPLQDAVRQLEAAGLVRS